MAARLDPPPLEVEQITPLQARERQRHGALLIDVRDDNERAGGMPEGAIGVARAALGSRIAELVQRHDQPLLTICATGQRSLLAADALRQLGYAQVASVSGGFRRWQADGLPVATGVFDADAGDRYSRHLLLPEVGAAGQLRLGQARVALIGAGGLGSPAALYLAAAGI